ncbi:hypothetical protein QBC43DRAFT_326478 [Cladorrhinum sp. PSN259]|nr:hypothetical protein QBC43DRAFT_326478 [Cladorrhinum sp. PSN259]
MNIAVVIFIHLLIFFLTGWLVGWWPTPFPKHSQNFLILTSFLTSFFCFDFAYRM